jgi:uncharacterized pyridoxal phosphate-containing UPF0001 family protein
LDQEVSKSGFKKEAVAQAVRDLQVYSNLEVQGLMCIPSPQGDTSLRFRELKQLKEDCAPMTQGMLSMGMSDDYEAAIQEGSTHIRIGTALFGPRRST